MQEQKFRQSKKLAGVLPDEKLLPLPIFSRREFTGINLLVQSASSNISASE